MMGGHSGVSSEEYSLYNDNTKKNKEVLYGKILNGGHFSINSISFTTNLTHLKLSDCKLTQFPADIPNIESIIEIDLSKNLLEDLPDSFTTLKQLRVLNLSDNCISKVPSVFYQGLHLVKNLNISKNRLVTFQKPPCCLTFLSYLDLSFNKLVAPPPWLLDEISSSLETVDLSCNPCFQLCPACPDNSQQVWRVIQVSDQVKTLKMNSCGFRGGINEKYLSNFKNVTHLDLGSTMIRGQPNFISDVSHLPETITDLSLENTSLASLSKSITSLSNLRTLDISKNIVQWFPPAVKDLKNLVVLRAERSKIFLIPPEMNELPNLKELYLSDNELNSSDGFEDLVSLEVLDLHGNQFITVPKFDNLLRLRALDFCQNYIEPPKLVTLGTRVCSYESLRDCLRSKHLNTKIERLNGAKDFPVIPEIDDNFSDIDPLSDSDYYIDAEGSCEDGANGVQEVGKEGYDSGTVEGKFQKETWELDSDDYFDPNAHRSTPMFLEKNSSETLTGELPYELTLHPHFFAPYRSVPPTDLPEDDLPPPVEGQFDD